MKAHDRLMAEDEQAARDLFTRRRMLTTMLGGLGAVALVGCSKTTPSTISANATSTTVAGSSVATPSTAGGSSTIAASGESECTTIPTETAGPYPGDGTNGPNVLTMDGVNRADIRTSLGSDVIVDGVTLTIRLAIIDVANGCVPYRGAAVYLWHCDAGGQYSMYSQGTTDETFLRGLQVADEDGMVTFTSVFPAAYSGRYPHIHFQVFDELSRATSGSNRIAVSQLALPESACETVYASGGYASSAANLAQTPLSRDNVFSDGVDHQMATVTGSVADGYVADLSVPV